MGEDLFIHPQKRVPSQRQVVHQRQKHMSSMGMHILLSPWNIIILGLLPWSINNWQALASPQLHSLSFILEGKILQKWKALSQERELFCHLRTLAWKSRTDGQLLWSFWLKCCLRILLSLPPPPPPPNMKQSIRLWYIHVIKAFSYKICQSKTGKHYTFALKWPYWEQTWQIKPVLN